MRIVEQSVSIESGCDLHSALERIEAAGRTCYRSEDKIGPGTAKAFVAMIMKRGHESVIEHVSASLRFVCDRGISHELVRHRLASYSQESTRYCNYGKADEIQVIEPPGLTNNQRSAWMIGCQHAERAYMEMLALGLSPQIARSVLPTCTKTEIVMTANLREFRHFFKLRCSQAAHPQMRALACKALDLLRGSVPVIFDDIQEAK